MLKKIIAVAITITIALVSVVISPPAYAYTQGDVDKFMFTGSCAYCDLNAAKLTKVYMYGAYLREAFLVGAYLDKAYTDLRMERWWRHQPI